jgi:site-specific DNA-methyltransferase (cytosine-N4-specific)
MVIHVPGISHLVGQIHCSDAGQFIARLPNESIDFVMTSPPYWGLRDYGVEGQIGLEKNPRKYIDTLVAVFRDLQRVLKAHGSFYLNLGDTYCSMKGSCFNAGGGARSIRQFAYRQLTRGTNPNRMLKADGRWLQPKQLLMIPARVAVGLQDDGWILRNDIIWYKPNGLPSSVRDRLANKYEHVFHFVKSRRYYYDLDSIRVPQASLRFAAGNGRSRNHQIYDRNADQRGVALGRKSPGGMVESTRTQRKKGAFRLLRADGKNPGDVVGAIEGQTGGNNKGPYRHNNLHIARLLRGRDTMHAAGKNPGDIVSARSRLVGLRKTSTKRKPPEPGEPGAFHPFGENPGGMSTTDQECLDLWKSALLDEYARIGRIGPKRFWGKHELLDERSGGFRALLNSGQSRNAGYSIIEGLPVGDELKQLLKNWWHDHSGHWLGRNPGDFWKISTEPFPQAHFAVYPEQLCVRPILSSCPPLVCKVCGKAAPPSFSTAPARHIPARDIWNERSRAGEDGMPVVHSAVHATAAGGGRPAAYTQRRIADTTSCSCRAPFEPGIVFDPFAGAGTTLVAAKRLGRRWLGCELNPEFVKMARHRLGLTECQDELQRRHSDAGGRWM